ncbi:hypothetical protein PITC_008600 [Penicillium italicum]|uniref:Uncharacterized protein n=1 Tax=Penicillium italicum TaxID=40296 RepID=A0A0A2L5A1_PENIT|nr:hypothetical protein PITC_008600 [Penicillium italicum]
MFLNTSPFSHFHNKMLISTRPLVRNLPKSSAQCHNPPIKNHIILILRRCSLP